MGVVQQVRPASSEIVSTRQPVPAVLVSLPRRQRSWMVWPDADAGRLTVVVT